ncbi:broad [Carabus blaptoides fortunei]
MAADHFCLKWNNFHCSLVNAFESLQSSEDLVDVTLMCEGRNVKAHRVILSACSPYFRNLFKETPCQHPVIILKDVLHCDLLAILQFMYQGEVLITQDGLASFLKTAELLQVSGLAGNSAAVSEQPIVPTQTVVPALAPIVPVQSNSPASPKTIVNKHPSDVTFTKQIEKENFAKKEVIEKHHTRFEPDTEPMQSCSYQTADDVIIKTESDDQDFQDMDYNTLSHDSLEDSGAGTEEQSILERSLTAQGKSNLCVTQRSTKFIKKLKRNRTFRRISKCTDTPVNCPHCFIQISRASNLKRHMDRCKISKVQNLLRDKILNTSNGESKTDTNKQDANITIVTDMGKESDKSGNVNTDSTVNNVGEELERKPTSKRISRTRRKISGLADGNKSKINYSNWPSKKPVNCPQCFKVIRQAQNLKKHLKSCTKKRQRESEMVYNVVLYPPE